MGLAESRGPTSGLRLHWALWRDSLQVDRHPVGDVPCCLWDFSKWKSLSPSWVSLHLWGVQSRLCVYDEDGSYTGEGLPVTWSTVRNYTAPFLVWLDFPTSPHLWTQTNIGLFPYFDYRCLVFLCLLGGGRWEEVELERQKTRVWSLLPQCRRETSFRVCLLCKGVLWWGLCLGDPTEVSVCSSFRKGYWPVFVFFVELFILLSSHEVPWPRSDSAFLHELHSSEPSLRILPAHLIRAWVISPQLPSAVDLC